MDEHDQHIIHSSEDPNWRTPQSCFDKLHEEFAFTLDGAADRESTKCLYYLGPESAYGEDALQVDLLSETCYFDPQLQRIFLNPPFSRTLSAAYRTGRIRRAGQWVEHPIDEAKAKSYDIEEWARWGWEWSQRGFTIVALLPFAPQTEWYRRYVYGHDLEPDGALGAAEPVGWLGHAAREERRLPHRISFLRATGEKAANAGVNTAIVVWKANPGIVGPWQPHSFYWSYR